MSGYHTTMLQVARELLARWDAAADAGQPVDVTPDMTRLTLETIGRAGLVTGSPPSTATDRIPSSPQ